MDSSSEPPVSGPPVAATRTCDNEPAGFTTALDTPFNILPTKMPTYSSEGYTYAGARSRRWRSSSMLMRRALLGACCASTSRRDSRAVERRPVEVAPAAGE